ncbi:MAG: oxygen-independent coproporphyrinogen III oxidase [Cyclobacteriaceae bacterium]
MEGNKKLEETSLIRKYNVPVPRYTSYPTVPAWQFSEQHQKLWPSLVKKIFDETNDSKGISLYIHLPFCEQLCTYCGCTQHITRNHEVEPAYLQAVIKEWQNYLHLLQRPAKIREIHLGGGTPTFFSPENLSFLIKAILSGSASKFQHDFSFEGHPNTTSLEHLEQLFELGFRRVSFGVQDFDEKVQVTINRIQPFENVEKVTRQARRTGYESINFDLVYGLPFQSLAVIEDTINKVIHLKPDRIAFYSYAHVPWKRPGQRKYTESDLPDNEYKRALYEKGKEMLIQAGYNEIGMDHFALPHDKLYQALAENKLHRNFMGYTTIETELMIGLGMSAISDAKYAFAQNVKKVKEYQTNIAQGNSTIIHGHVLTEEDLLIGSLIRELICHGEINWKESQYSNLPVLAQQQLQEMQKEGLVVWNDKSLKVLAKGKPFIRNICSLIDLRNWALKKDQPMYSKSI